MMSSNVRGYHSKKEVIANILHYFTMDIVCLQETHVTGNSKIKIPGFYSFAKNRPNAGSKGGVAILVREILKDSAVLIHESKDSEMIAVKFCCFKPNLVVINYYARQENTTPANVISDHLSEIFSLTERLTTEGNMVIAAGDWNVSVGAEVLTDNCPDLSRGGKLFNTLMEMNPELELLNCRHDGPSITHIDASGGRGRCLDLVIANSAAAERTGGVIVDTDRFITPYRFIARTEERRFTDHLTVHWEMNLPEIAVKEDESQYEVWNRTKRLGDGWYAYHLDKGTGKLVKLLNQRESSDYVMKRLTKEDTNAKYRGYGLRVIEPGKWDAVEDRRIELYRAEEVQKVVNKVKEDRKNYRVPLQVFAMRKHHLTAERGDMFSAVIHPETGKAVETREGVMSAILRHTEITLTQRKEQPECYKLLTKSKREFVEICKMEEETAKNNTILFEDFLETLQDLASRNKNCYADLKKWGPKFRIFIYWFLKRVYETADVPEKFMETNLQALYKGKGSRRDLSSYRFLHLKEGIPKLFEALVMQKCKADMWAGFPDTQIGGLPNSRCEEHLYVIMTMMALTETNTAWAPRGFIVIFKDLEKAFDSVSCIHTLASAAEDGVRGQRLTLLDELNKETTFRLVGDAERKTFKKPFAGAQGTCFAATSMSSAMAKPQHRMIDSYMRRTGKELGVRVFKERILIDEVNFVDDEGAVCGSADSARKKGEIITNASYELNVKVHDQKTRWMAFGKEDWVAEVKKELETNPIVIQGHPIKQSSQEKYLGMLLSDEGRKKTIRDQMEYRFSQCVMKIQQIRGMLERPTMRAIGWLACLRTLFDSIVTSTAMYSAGAWVGMVERDYHYANQEMKRLLLMLLNLNSKVNLLHLCYELKLLPWAHEIRRRKLTFVSFLCHTKAGQASRLAVAESNIEWKKGLVYEARKIASKVGLPDPSLVYLSTEAVSEAISQQARKECWEAMLAGKYIHADIKTEAFEPTYMFDPSLTNQDQKILLAFRMGTMYFKRRYSKMFEDVLCPFCSVEDDTLDHSLTCLKNPVRKPRTKELEDMLPYLRELDKLREEKFSCGLFPGL